MPAHLFALTATEAMPAKIAKLLDAAKAGVSRRLQQLERGEETTQGPAVFSVFGQKQQER